MNGWRTRVSQAFIPGIYQYIEMSKENQNTKL